MTDIGKKYGFFTVLEYAGKSEKGEKLIRCLCSCGKIHTVLLSKARHGHTKSCGCGDGKSIRERFYGMVNKNGSDGTWLWNGKLNKKGYGLFGKRLAHRFCWEIEIGLIPNGLYVLHKNDNPRDVNPENLFLGTNLDNIRDMNKKNRQAIGSINGISKLTENIVSEIRSLYKKGVHQSELASKFNVHQSVISRAVNNKTWRHV